MKHLWRIFLVWVGKYLLPLCNEVMEVLFSRNGSFKLKIEDLSYGDEGDGLMIVTMTRFINVKPPLIYSVKF